MKGDEGVRGCVSKPFSALWGRGHARGGSPSTFREAGGDRREKTQRSALVPVTPGVRSPLCCTKLFPVARLRYP